MGFFTPDTSHYSQYTDQGKFILIWRISVTFGVLFFLLGFVIVFANPFMAALYFIIFLIISSAVIYLRYQKKYAPVFCVYAISSSILIAISLQLETGVVHYPEFFWVLAIIVFSFIGLERKMAMLIMLFNLLSVGAHFVFCVNRNIEVQQPQTNMQLMGGFLEIAAAFFVIGYFFHQYFLFQQHAETQVKLVNEELAEQNQVIVRKNEENVVLVKEIHHRVKNNLQIIVSLLRMHSDEVKSKETKQHFGEAINRIMAMSLIHQNLYSGKELSNIDFEGYLRQLSYEIITSTGNGISYDCRIHASVDRIGLKTIVPIGLLVNELMTNSIKHAFKEMPSGTITIELNQRQDDVITMLYSDDGHWLNAKKEHGFGLELIDLLTNQLDGKFERSESVYHFELSNLDH
ncbi:MAG TPA: sensor histidine kinase [Fluviicola sp.]|nr:sensor histidine kinase [Fluviicola sp.]